MEKIGNFHRGCKILEYSIEKGRRRVSLSCSCGNIFKRRVDSVFEKTRNHNISCGCKSIVTQKGVNKYDYSFFTGKMYREVKVLNIFEKIHNKHFVKFYNLLCKCGNIYSHQCTDFLRRKNEFVPVNCGCSIDIRNFSRTYGEATYKSIYSKYSRTGTRRDLGLLDYDTWKNIVSKPCNYCGEFQYKNIYYNNNDVFKNKRNKITKVRKLKISDETLEKYTVPCCGIDRVDNNKGYILENCVSCCISCNIMKNVLTLDQFYSKIEKILNLKKEKELLKDTNDQINY